MHGTGWKTCAKETMATLFDDLDEATGSQGRKSSRNRSGHAPLFLIFKFDRCTGTCIWQSSGMTMFLIGNTSGVYQLKESSANPIDRLYYCSWMEHAFYHILAKFCMAWTWHERTMSEPVFFDYLRDRAMLVWPQKNSAYPKSAKVDFTIERKWWKK